MTGAEARHMNHGRRWLLLGLVLVLVVWGSPPGSAQSFQEDIQRRHADILRLTGEGKYAEALAQAEALLALVHQARGPHDPLFVQALSATAMLSWLQGAPQQGELLYRRALHLLEATVGPDDRALVPLLLSWGTLARDQRRLQQAEQLLTRALSLGERHAAEDASAVLAILVALAGVYEDLGNYQRAEQELHRALQMVGPDQQDTDPALLPVLHGLGRVSHALGAWSKATTFLHKALRLHAVHAPDHAQRASVLIDLAVVYQDHRDYVQAEALLQRARASLEQRRGADAVHVVPALYGLARLALAKGDYAGAEALLVQSLTSMERAYGKAHPNVAPYIFGLGAVWAAQARYDAATGAYRHVLAIWEQALGKEHPSVAYVLYHLAMLYAHQGHAAAAEPLYHQALHIWDRVLGSAHPLVAAVMSHVGSLAEARGDLQHAHQWFARALTVWQQALGPDHPDVAIAYNGLARVHAQRGELAQAIALLAQASDILERTLYRNLRIGSERQRGLYLANEILGNTNRTLALHLQTAPHSADAARLALRTVLRRKGMLLEAQVTTRQRVWHQLDTEGRKLLAALEQWRELRTRLALHDAATQDAAEDAESPLAAVVDDLIEEHEQALARATASGQAEMALPTLADVARRLPQDALLIEFVAYVPLAAGLSPPDQPVPPRRYAVYLLHRDGTLHWADLGEAQDIDSAVAAMRRALQNVRQHDWQPSSHALYQKIVQPLTPWLEKARHLLLSPDGDLHLVPFAALVDAHGTLLIERYQLTYLTTGRELLHTPQPQPAPGPPIIFAGPDFDAPLTESPPTATSLPPDASSAAMPQRATTLPAFTPLPGAAHEGQALQQHLPQAVVVTGAEATEARLKAVQRPRLLHLATHGFFFPYQPPVLSAHTALPTSGPTAPRGFTVTAEVAQAAVHGRAEANPLLRAGLALAGANRPPAEPEDGILTALEAAALDLRGTQLVVLSACETGLGDIRDGESVYGLRRAFTIAGAESQVTTLWRVSDLVTQELMAAYYQRLVAGEARSEALRQVQLARARNHEWSHPFYWAAFLFSGHWGPMFHEASGAE